MSPSPTSHSSLRTGVRVLGLLSLGACGSGGEIIAEEVASCVEVATGLALPESVLETSGVAIGRRDPSVIWTHNDSGGEPMLFAVSRSGASLGQVRVAGAQSRDWEDMEIARCATGSCLYLADIGDNPEERAEILVYRVPEPSPADERTAEADAFRMRYPDRARDAEAIFVLPGEALYVVSKGRSDAAGLYRYPGALRSDEVVTLERVQEITQSRPSAPNQITGASSSPDGQRVAVRSYTSLYLYGVEAAALTAAPLYSQSLHTLEEPQGEAIALGDSGLVVLTSEAVGSSPPSMSLLRCEVGS